MARRILLPIFLVLGVLIAVLPFVVTILASLKKKNELIKGIFSVPKDPQWHNYVEAWTTGHFGRFFVNSVIVAAGVVIPTIVLTSMAGYGLARFRFRGSRLVLGLLLVGMVIPLQALVVPLYYVLREAHMLDSLIGLIIPQIAMSIPFGTLLMHQAYRSVPQDIMEASIVDGASSWRTLWDVMYPLSRPMIGTLGLMIFIWTWNEFMLPLVVNVDAKYHTLPVGLLNFQERWTSNIPVIAAGSTIIFLPLVAMFIVFQRQLVAGLTAGAVKG